MIESGQAALAALEREPFGHHLVAEGELYLERPLPFLVTLDTRGLEPSEHSLVTAEASRFLIHAPQASSLPATVATVLRALRRHSQRVVLIDVVTRPAAAEAQKVSVCARGRGNLDRELAAFARPLERTTCFEGVAIAKAPRDHPLVEEGVLDDLGAALVEIEVPRVWRAPDDGDIYPLVLRDARRGLSRAIQALCHRFARDFTERLVPHPGVFGLRRATDAVLEVDRTLARVASSFSFLLSCTPTNLEEAWQEFRTSEEDRMPRFHYRPLAIDTDVLKRQLYLTPMEYVHDPALEELFRDQRDRLAEELTMLEHRDTREFLFGSLRLYGGVEDELLELARGVSRMAEGAPDEPEKERVDCHGFLELATTELRHYVPDPSDPVTCCISESVDSLIVDRGVLLIGRNLSVSPSRARALVAHEVGTHIVTYLNAREQSLLQLRVGLPGYDELQEGLAVLAEHLVGALTPGRMRLLAARVVAVRALVDGADFIEIYRQLVKKMKLGKRLAFSTTTRVCRGGGLTKDAVYLRGIAALLRYFNDGGSFEPLLVGKIATPHLPLVEELMAREVIGRPHHVPRHFRSEEGAARIERLRDGATLLDLIDRRAS